jgi:hypothetical protein
MDIPAREKWSKSPVIERTLEALKHNAVLDRLMAERTNKAWVEIAERNKADVMIVGRDNPTYQAIKKFWERPSD